MVAEIMQFFKTCEQIFVEDLLQLLGRNLPQLIAKIEIEKQRNYQFQARCHGKFGVVSLPGGNLGWVAPDLQLTGGAPISNDGNISAGPAPHNSSHQRQNQSLTTIAGATGNLASSAQDAAAQENWTKINSAFTLKTVYSAGLAVLEVLRLLNAHHATTVSTAKIAACETHIGAYLFSTNLADDSAAYLAAGGFRVPAELYPKVLSSGILLDLLAGVCGSFSLETSSLEGSSMEDGSMGDDGNLLLARSSSTKRQRPEDAALTSLTSSSLGGVIPRLVCWNLLHILGTDPLLSEVVNGPRLLSRIQVNPGALSHHPGVGPPTTNHGLLGAVEKFVKTFFLGGLEQPNAAGGRIGGAPRHYEHDYTELPRLLVSPEETDAFLQKRLEALIKTADALTSCSPSFSGASSCAAGVPTTFDEDAFEVLEQLIYLILLHMALLKHCPQSCAQKLSPSLVRLQRGAFGEMRNIHVEMNTLLSMLEQVVEGASCVRGTYGAAGHGGAMGGGVGQTQRGGESGSGGLYGLHNGGAGGLYGGGMMGGGPPGAPGGGMMGGGSMGAMGW